MIPYLYLNVKMTLKYIKQFVKQNAINVLIYNFLQFNINIIPNHLQIF